MPVVDVAHDFSRAIVIRCDGTSAIGMGHVTRCLALADELKALPDLRVSFLMRDLSSAGAKAVQAAGFDATAIAAPADTDYAGELRESLQSAGARAVVVDVRDALTREALESIRSAGVRVVTIDDGSERRLASDLAFYPPVPQVEEMDWAGFAGKRYAGWEWVLLCREFKKGTESTPSPFTSPELSDASPSIDLLVTMGGSDPAGMTEFAMSALERLPMPLAIRLVIGPAFTRVATLLDVLARSPHSIQIARAPASLAPLMRISRLALASFGMSAYELAACGVPAVHLCLSDDHARSSSAFEREGAAVTAGVFGRVDPAQLADAVGRIMRQAGRRGEMARNARRLVDGRGASRVAGVVAAAL